MLLTNDLKIRGFLGFFVSLKFFYVFLEVHGGPSAEPDGPGWMEKPIIDEHGGQADGH